MGAPTKPPTPAKKPAPNAPRHATADGFQAARVASPFDTHTAALDRSKAAAGILRRLTEKSAFPVEISNELDRVAKSAISGDEWQLLQRVVLSGPAPATADETARESRRFVNDLEGPLARVSASWHLRKLREAGTSMSDLLRGADVVIVEGGPLFEVFAGIGGKPSGAHPFPGAMAVVIKDFGTLYFAKAGENLQVRVEAPLVQLRKTAPLLMAFFEKHFAVGQNMGPMGCSPRTLATGKAVKMLCD